MIVKRSRNFSNNEKKEKNFKKDMKMIDKGEMDMTSKIILSPSLNAIRGNIIKSIGTGALYGAGLGLAGLGIKNGTLAAIGTSRALKKKLPIKKYIKKYINAFNKKNELNDVEILKDSAKRFGTTFGIASIGSKIGRYSFDKYDNLAERSSDIFDVRSGKMSKEDFIKKHYGKDYLNKIKNIDNDNSKK